MLGCMVASSPHLSPSILLALLLAGSLSGADTPDFAREILPLLSDNCFACHGPDEGHRKAKLRLDLRDAALAGTKGRPAIVAGDVTRGTLLERLTTSDPDELMPPADAHRQPLKPQQVDLLKRWIAAGAPWGRHWAFVPPVRPGVPALADTTSPIDAFIRTRLAQEKLSPAKPAARHAQLRRLSFTLTSPTSATNPTRSSNSTTRIHAPQAATPPTASSPDA